VRGSRSSATKARFRAPIHSGDLVAAVVVDPEQVDRGRDRREVAVQYHFSESERLQVVGDILGIGSAQHRVEEQPVLRPVHAPGGVGVGLRGRVRGHHRVEVERDPALGYTVTFHPAA
jgi:hypothetical protein